MGGATVRETHPKKTMRMKNREPNSHSHCRHMGDDEEKIKNQCMCAIDGATHVFTHAMMMKKIS